MPRRRRVIYAGRGGIRRERPTILFGGARRRRLIARTLVAALLVAGCAAAVALAADSEREPAAEPEGVPNARAHPAPTPPPDDGQAVEGPADPPIAWRASVARGLPYSGGRLVRGIKLPAAGRDYFTWDPVRRRSPNRWWRRWGTDALLRTLLKVVREYRVDHPDAPRVGIGDLSRPRGGWFGRQYGGLGHASHQNGLDVDVYYPRRDGLQRRPRTPEQVDRELAQDLVDRFVDAGAQKVFVGPSLRLKGPRRVVSALVHHDDHLHVRLPPPPGR